MIKTERCIFSASMAQKLLGTTPFLWAESCFLCNQHCNPVLQNYKILRPENPRGSQLPKIPIVLCVLVTLGIRVKCGQEITIQSSASISYIYTCGKMEMISQYKWETYHMIPSDKCFRYQACLLYLLENI